MPEPPDSAGETLLKKQIIASCKFVNPDYIHKGMLFIKRRFCKTLFLINLFPLKLKSLHILLKIIPLNEQEVLKNRFAPVPTCLSVIQKMSVLLSAFCLIAKIKSSNRNLCSGFIFALALKQATFLVLRSHPIKGTDLNLQKP